MQHPYLAIGALVYLGLALILGIVGRNRKLGGWAYFFGSLVLTPAIGLILVMASDAKPGRHLTTT